MKYKNILVTGGAGFIGSHLTERLLRDGCTVTVIDDLSEGKWENIPPHPNLIKHQMSILDNIDEIVKDKEVIFHLAALPRLQRSVDDPLGTHKVNVDGTLNLLMAARKYGVKRFIFSSSSSIYGNQEHFPFTEDLSPNPLVPYSLHKLMAEEYGRIFSKIWGLGTVSLRYFNVYGPRMNPNGAYANLLPKFIKIMSEDKIPVINGDGNQTRDFTYISDVVEANILAAESDVTGEVINIGFGKNISVNQVVETLNKLLGKNIKPTYGPPVIEPRRTLSNCNKAKKLLGWEPKVSFEEGLKKMLPEKKTTNYDLSILIPARNEMFLANTVKNILENIEGNTEVIVILDGVLANPPVPENERVKVVLLPESIGQRAATNLACKLSKAKYVMKADAHCAFDKGFDLKMIAEMHDDWTMVPIMKNLHAFDWVCPEGHRRYQGPSGLCKECGKPTTRDIVWQAKPSPNSVSYCFDSTPHFQYFGEYARRPEGRGEITETMSLQGSCWMLTRDKYWELNVCDEKFGSWGSQGIEVAVKTWLSGGRVMVNKKTWYAHMFRTQGGDFGFPYPISGKDQEKAKNTARDLFFNDKWPLQKLPLSWLVEKFWPVPGWTDDDLKKLKENTFRFQEDSGPKPAESEPAETDKTINKGIVYFTDHLLNMKMAGQVREQLQNVSNEKNIPIVSVSLKPIPGFGEVNIHLDTERDVTTRNKQILAGLEASKADVIFICEKDILYDPSHFDFIPPKKGIFYSNQGVGLCGYREDLLEYYKNHQTRSPEPIGSWKSENPNKKIEEGHEIYKSS